MLVLLQLHSPVTVLQTPTVEKSLHPVSTQFCALKQITPKHKINTGTAHRLGLRRVSNITCLKFRAQALCELSSFQALLRLLHRHYNRHGHLYRLSALQDIIPIPMMMSCLITRPHFFTIPPRLSRSLRFNQKLESLLLFFCDALKTV